MKTRKFAIAVLLVLGLISTSINSIYGYTATKNIGHELAADPNDSNGGGNPVPPIGH